MARPFQEVQVFGIQNRQVSDRTKRPWIVRWAVAGKQHSRSFRTKGEGERYRSLLTHAKTTGEVFDELTGEPLAWQPRPGDVQAHVWARRWLAEEWPEWAPRTRASAVEALVRFVPLLVVPDAPVPPAGLRRSLFASLPPGSGPTADDPSEKWLDR